MIRKTMALTLVTTALAGLLPSGVHAAEQKFAFVNLDKIFNDYDKTRKAQLQLNEQVEEYKDERTKLVEDYTKLEESFNAIREDAQNAALSEEARTAKRDEAEEKLVEMREFKSKIRRYDETRRKQLDDQSLRIRKDIVAELTGAMEVYAREQGYAAVMDSSGASMNGVPTLVYTDTRHDITDAFVEYLNQQRKEE